MRQVRPSPTVHDTAVLPSIRTLWRLVAGVSGGEPSFLNTALHIGHGRFVRNDADARRTRLRQRAW